MSFQAPKEDTNVIFREPKTHNIPVQNITTGNTTPTSPTSANVPRGEPDGEAESFLRQKEAQLREKRERERLAKELDKRAKEKEQRDKANALNQKSAAEKLPEKTVAEKSNNNNKVDVKSKPANNNKEIVEPVSPVSPTPKVPAKQSQEKIKPKTPPPVKEKPELKPVEKQPSKAPSSVKSQQPKQQLPPVKQFYFPFGKPVQEDQDAVLSKITDAFGKIEGGKASKIQMGDVAKVKNFHNCNFIYFFMNYKFSFV